MGQSAIKNPRRIVVLPGGGGTDPALEARVEYLEDNTYKITYFAEINGTTGTITKPTNSTILTDQFFGGVDAYVSTIQNGQPTGIFPQTAGGVAVDVTSFNTAGDFVLNGTPSAYPVALIYKLSIAAINWQNLDQDYVLDMEITDTQIGLIINGATDYPTPLDADKIGIWDTLNSLFKALTWANLKATLKTYFDTLYAPIGGIKRIIRYTTTTGAVTGTSANTLCASYLVSGGVNVVGDILLLAFRTIKTNTNGTYTIRLYVNTSSSLSGATLLGTYTTGSAPTVTTEFGRYLAIKSSTNTEVSPSAIASVPPLNAYNAVVTNANIDHTSAQYYIVGIQPSGSNADVISVSWFSMISL